MRGGYLLGQQEMAHARGGTIFAPVSKQDPKHGRWILPLVVLALVAFTFTFVNSLPPAEAPTTTVAPAGGQTTTTEAPEETTTTTLAPEIVAFSASADSLAARADELSDEAQLVNDDYDDAGYGATRDALSNVKAETEDFVVEVGEVAVPPAAAEKWTDVTIAAAAMQAGADKMLDGLVNTEGSERRLEGLEDYNIAAATLIQALDAAKDAATSS
jgi:hypothetical protein